MLLRYLTALVDSDAAVRLFAEQSLTSLFHNKAAPLKFHLQFVEALFYLNGCDAHPKYCKFSAEEQAFNRLFVLSGRDRREKRMVVYRYMLRFMSEEQKFSCSAKLVQEVIGAIVDEVMPINADTAEAVEDALLLLSSKDMKLSVNKKCAGMYVRLLLACFLSFFFSRCD